MTITASLKIAAAALAGLALAGTASAAVTFSYDPFGAGGVPSNEFVVVDFDHPNATGYSYTQSSGATQIFTPSSPFYETGVYNDGFPNILISGIAAAPAMGGGAYDESNFEAVLTGGTFTLLTPGVEHLSVYIGSSDTYNEITFEDQYGNIIQSFGGHDIMPPANGDQAGYSTNGRVDFDLGGDKAYKVLFSATGNSFEFDNIAASVPEPATWAMMLFGIGGLGVAMRGARSQQVALAA